MLEALLVSARSPDPNTQVGACIVKDNHILGSGYNGFPKGISTYSLPWERTADNPLHTKYPYVVHAEKNALFNATSSVKNGILYTTMYPCNECAKDIIQAEISQVIYLNNPYQNTWQNQAAAKMFHLVDLPTKQHVWESTIAQEIQGLLKFWSTNF